MRGPPGRRKQHEKLTQVAKSARRLLKSLGIDDADNAVDGPGDHEIFMALVLAGEPDENAVLEATRRIGRLVEIFEGVVAVGELERRAHQAAIELAAVGKLTVREGNPGDDAVNTEDGTRSSIASTASCLSRSMWSFMALSASGECPANPWPRPRPVAAPGSGIIAVAAVQYAVGVASPDT